MNRIKRVSAVLGLIVAAGGAWGVVSGGFQSAYNFVFSKFSTKSLSATPIQFISSQDIDQIDPSQPGEPIPAFEANGRPFDYHQPPARDGYLIHYEWQYSGRQGSGDLYFVVFDEAVNPARLVTPNTLVAVGDTASNGSPQTIGTDFFFELGKVSPKPKLVMLLTTSDTAGSSVAELSHQEVSLPSPAQSVAYSEGSR
jgi:hypothetical protein